MSKEEKTKVTVIETRGTEGAEWGISTKGENPEPEHYFPMTDKETAFRLRDEINCICPSSGEQTS